MKRLLGATAKAGMVTGLWAMLMMIPGFNIIGLIVVMLPLWMLHDMGVRGLGEPNNGFFVPTAQGYMLGAVIIFVAWLLLFLLVRGSPERKPS